MTPKILLMLPPGWDALGPENFVSPNFQTIVYGRDDFAPADIDIFVGFRPPPGFLKSLPHLKAILSLGAGVDGFLKDPDFPRAIPLARTADPNLAAEMSEYVAMHVLILHRGQRFFDAAQREHRWRQVMMTNRAKDKRIGLLGLGVIGGQIAQRLQTFDFQLSGWSRTRKSLPNLKSFAGESELPAFLGQCDILVCVLPLTPDTKGILNAKLFAQLPKGAAIINVARGQHLIEEDLIAALDSGHLSAAVLDVFQTEPLPDDSPIWWHAKITATPHIAGIPSATAALAFVEDSVARIASGQPLPNLLDPVRGY